MYKDVCKKYQKMNWLKSMVEIILVLWLGYLV